MPNLSDIMHNALWVEVMDGQRHAERLALAALISAGLGNQDGAQKFFGDYESATIPGYIDNLDKEIKAANAALAALKGVTMTVSPAGRQAKEAVSRSQVEAQQGARRRIL